MPDRPLLAQLPMLTYDELTVLLAGLGRIEAEMGNVSQLASSDVILGITSEVQQIAWSLRTAVCEARYSCHRPDGGALEPFRQAWETSPNG